MQEGPAQQRPKVPPVWGTQDCFLSEGLGCVEGLGAAGLTVGTWLGDQVAVKDPPPPRG